MRYIDKIFGPVFWIAGCVLLLAIATSLSGCASPGGGGVSPPPEYLMRPANRFPRVKGGDDAKVRLAEAAKVHNRNRRKIRGLQDYIKTSRRD